MFDEREIQTIKDEKITICEYTTQRFMFYTFAILSQESRLICFYGGV